MVDDIAIGHFHDGDPGGISELTIGNVGKADLPAICEREDGFVRAGPDIIFIGDGRRSVARAVAGLVEHDTSAAQNEDSSSSGEHFVCSPFRQGDTMFDTLQGNFGCIGTPGGEDAVAIACIEQSVGKCFVIRVLGYPGLQLSLFGRGKLLMNEVGEKAGHSLDFL